MDERAASVVELTSAYDFPATLDRLSNAFEKAGLKIFARIDHGAAAREAGLNMPPTVVVIFGSPQVGTPLMLVSPVLALDLPLRVLVREDSSGRTIVAYHPAAAITTVTVLTSEQLARFSKAETLIANTINGE